MLALHRPGLTDPCSAASRHPCFQMWELQPGWDWGAGGLWHWPMGSAAGCTLCHAAYSQATDILDPCHVQALLGVLAVVNKAQDLCSHEAECLLGDAGRKQADILGVPGILQVLFYLCSSFRGMACRCSAVSQVRHAHVGPSAAHSTAGPGAGRTQAWSQEGDRR